MKSTEKSITLNDDGREAVQDTCTLIHRLSNRPTHVNEIVPDPPSYAAYHDAAAEGAGGVWFSLTNNMQPLLWRTTFPRDIAKSVISDDNPTGTITNSDLELAAEVLAVGVILTNAPEIKHKTLGTLSDNSATVGWIDRMASRSIFPTAGRLLKGLAYMLHTSHAGQVITMHVPGDKNIMADVASRPSKAVELFAPHVSELTDEEFRSSFDTAFPLPNNQEWTLAPVPEWLKFNVFETLRGKRLDLRQWTTRRRSGTGRHGNITADSTSQAAAGSPLQTHATCSSHLLLPCGKVSTASDVESRFSQSRKLSEPLPKSTFWTDIKTQDDPPQHSIHWTSQ
jgi:hypothetical protein